MNRAFAIELRPEVGFEMAAIVIAGEVHSFDVTLGRWRRGDYADSWRAQLAALLAGTPAVALMFAVPEAGTGEPFQAFVCERLEADAVAVTQRAYGPAAQTDEQGLILTPLAAPPQDELGTTTLTAVAAFIEAAAQAERLRDPAAAVKPSLPSAATLEARSLAIREALLAPLTLPAGWSPVVSLALPTVWPLRPGAELVSYLAATRFGASPTVFEHSDLLACVHHDALGLRETRRQRLSVEVARAGHAAVVPLAAAELEHVQALPPLDETLAAIALGRVDPGHDATLRAHYRFAQRRSGWLCELTRPRHPTFWSWIEGSISGSS